MSRVVSLAEALKPRAALILEAVASRAVSGSYPQPGRFAGYKASEGLSVELERVEAGTFLVCVRPGIDSSRDSCRMLLSDLRMTDIREVGRSDAVVLESGIVERKRFSVDLKHAIKDSETFEHEFSRTTRFRQAAKQAWEVAAKASLSAEYAGIKGSLEVSGKYGRQYEQESGQSATARDRVSKTFEFTGPIQFEVEAYRAMSRERRIVTARCDFDFGINIDPGGGFPGIISWDSFRAGFLPVARRTAPRGETYYREFMDRPLADSEIEALERPSDALIQFPVEYDSVETQVLREI